MERFLFYAFAAMAVGGAGIVVGARNPLHGALALVFSFFGLAGIYVMLAAPFVAVIQVLVYAGAVMVLFVFVIMLLNLKPDELRGGRVTFFKIAGSAGVAAGTFLLARAVSGVSAGRDAARADASFGTVQRVGAVIFSDFGLAFEATSLLLLVAIVAAVVVAKAKI